VIFLIKKKDLAVNYMEMENVIEDKNIQSEHNSVVPAAAFRAGGGR
jgi:hypothetical protein